MVMRASDDDRRRVVTSLERHTAAGRLRLEEFDQRVTAALAAVTLDDLAAVTSDLPVEPPQVDEEEDPERARALLVAFGLAAITIILLAVVLAVAR